MHLSQRFRNSSIYILTLSAVILPLLLSQTDTQVVVGKSITDAPTGFTLAPEFAAFYAANGGLALFGYPVSAPRVEGRYLVQWTERQRLEWHPENIGTNFDVLLGLLGRELTQDLDGPLFTQPAPGNTQATGSLYFPETGHVVAAPFADYWRRNGALTVFGYPISAPHTNESGLEIQWFERARFEYHPELPSSHKVLLGHLGLEFQRRQGVPRYELQVGPQAAPDAQLRVDLAQGGESDDPAFFDNAQDAALALGPGQVRLDNIFNYYHIVQRDTSGALYFRWVEFDRILDGIVSMGKTPMISLSYMPETMSASGKSRIVPPVDYNEWASVVYATVKHVNVDRKLGVRYWEVWNEPNEWSFWQGSYPDYLRLYDVSVEAVRKADPTALVGGPALSRFSAGHLHEFFQHEVSRGVLGQIDFISWHSYGQTPSEIAADIRHARGIAAAYPQFSPELFITEFNVLQGSGDTSANAHTDKVEGAIALLSAIEAMQRERLDRAFLFELKDGQGPSRFWGRWGILANDASPKPIYHVLKAYRQRPSGALPVQLIHGAGNSNVGLMAFGSSKKATLLLWYTGEQPASIKITLPAAFAALEFDRLLFDAATNNPALSGNATLKHSSARHAGDLVFDLKPRSLVILTSR